MLQLLTQLNMTTITRNSNPRRFPCYNMLITLWQGYAHGRYAMKHVSSTSMVEGDRGRSHSVPHQVSVKYNN